ncbi:MAG: hypothetical protein ACRC28_11015 [Clostridium sp.]|uniref:hypothetical protein n=1 Tax=Clostridium sp. TaxID=1506 RepID=UPI003F353E6E
MKINEKDIMEFVDSKYTEETLKVIEYLKEDMMPYKELKESNVMRAALVWILKYKGYSYLSNKIYMLFNKREIDYKEVYEALINAKIIKREKIGFVSDVDFKRGIVFKSSKGINRSYYIKLIKDVYPFKIKYISNEYRGFVDIKFEDKEYYSKIDIIVSIPENVKYPINIREKIIVYTDYKVKFFEIDILKIDEVMESSFYDLKILNTLSMMKERTRRIIAVGKGIERLQKEKSEEFALEYLTEIKNKSISMEIFSRYKEWIETVDGKINVEFYLKIIEAYLDMDEIDVKLGYMIEEFILTSPLLKENIRMYLEEFYKLGYITELTEEILEVMKVSDFSLEIKKKFKVLDKETLEDFKEGNVSLEMANKILLSKGIKYDKRLIKIMYDFYEETDDVKAIEKVIKKKDRLGFRIKDGDIVSLINKKREGIDVRDEAILNGGKSYKDKNRYIRDEIELIKIKRILDKNQKE